MNNLPPNTFALSIIENNDDVVPAEYEWVLELTPQSCRQLRPHLEYEILEGRVTELADGRTRWELNLAREKSLAFKKALFTALYTLSDN